MNIVFHNAMDKPGELRVSVDGQMMSARGLDVLVQHLNYDVGVKETIATAYAAYMNKCPLCKGSGQVFNPSAGNCESSWATCSACSGTGVRSTV
jgi:hypothetical protein